MYVGSINPPFVFLYAQRFHFLARHGQPSCRTYAFSDDTEILDIAGESYEVVSLQHERGHGMSMFAIYMRAIELYFRVR